MGESTVTCNATDLAGNAATATTFSVRVRDTTPPVIDAHGNETVEASSPLGAVLNYISPETHDLVEGQRTAACLPAPGSLFALGTTTVKCDAIDSAENAAIPTTFTVAVRDTTPPLVESPGDEFVEATGSQGAVVSYVDPSTSDLVDGATTAQCLPPSDGTFAIGTTTVICTATDAAGNASSPSTFSVTVRDTTPPTISGIDNIAVETTEPFGAIVNYSVPNTTDAVDGAGLATCDVPPGAFVVGVTTVTCTAADTSGNRAPPRSFTVTVTPASPVTSFVGGLLTVLGTVNDDSIRLSKLGRGFRVHTSFGDLTIPSRRSLTTVVASARGGNDTVDLALLSRSQVARVDGGSGDDTVTTGAGDDIILGGTGDDVLVGNQGNNLLLGGLGSDRLSSSRGSDLLIAGALQESAGAIDFAAVLDWWRTPPTPLAHHAAFQQLVDNLLDDDEYDTLTSGPGADFFAFGSADLVTDRRAIDTCVVRTPIQSTVSRC
jgi:Ca2+-binding RTX toxin-like protein